MAKIVQRKGSNLVVKMSASQKISEFVDSKYPKTGTVTFKTANRIIGMREDNNTAVFVKAALGNMLNGNAGSFSVKAPLTVAADYEEQLVEAIGAIHKATDYALSMAYNELDEEDKKIGEQIARQNVLRQSLLGMCKARAHAEDDVEAFLQARGLIIVPKGIQLESTIISGTRLYEDPQQPGYKQKDDEDHTPVWVKNGEIFGRKRVPLKTEKVTLLAFQEIATIAQSWEEFWASHPLVDADQIISDYCKWAGTLGHQDHNVERQTLSEEVINQITRQAAELYKEM